MNPIKVIKNVSGQTYDELESSLKAMGIEIRATTLANRYKSTSAHSKMTAEEMRKLSLALTSDTPPDGAKDFIDAFAETVYMLNELLGTNIVPIGGGNNNEDIITDEDFDDDDEVTEVDDGDEWDVDSDDDWDVDIDDWDDVDWGDDEEEESTSNDDLMDMIFDDDIPEVPESDDDNIFNVLEEDEGSNEPTPSTPENFENQSWLDEDDDYDLDEVKV